MSCCWDDLLGCSEELDASTETMDADLERELDGLDGLDPELGPADDPEDPQDDRVELQDRDADAALRAMLRRELERPDFSRGYAYLKVPRGSSLGLLERARWF